MITVLAEKILTEAKQPVTEDVVYVYAVVEGWDGDQLSVKSFTKLTIRLVINGKQWRAISGQQQPQLLQWWRW
jgi:hypothetical protein